MQSMAHKIWASAQQNLRAMLNADIYNLWFAPVQAVAIDTDVLTLEVENDFCEVWLKDNYLGLIRDVLTVAAGQPLQDRFRIAGVAAATARSAGPTTTSKHERRTESEPAERSSAVREPTFNPRITFD